MPDAAPLAPCFERFTLLTSDRQISFLFDGRGKRPWAVSKSGAMDALSAEYRNHCLAFKLLGNRVPAIKGITRRADCTSITIEYITERTLVNIVSSVVFKKRQTFIREALKHIDFCCNVYRTLANQALADYQDVSETEVADLLEGLTEFLQDSNEKKLLRSALCQTIGSPMPRMVQHGDFCVRNVLIANRGRGRVLIDWEDMREHRYAFCDFSLLVLSLKEVYSQFFNCAMDDMERVPEIKVGLKKAENEIAKILGMNRKDIQPAKILGLSSLCRQNFEKKRTRTALNIFKELVYITNKTAPYFPNKGSI